MNEYCLNAGSNLEFALFMAFFVLVGHMLIHYGMPRRPYIPKQFRETDLNTEEAQRRVSLFSEILKEKIGEKK
tara:strand:+ start:925 stop:1143 length:219 start_codon:yes stop_codon:yes gene_type:complete